MGMSFVFWAMRNFSGRMFGMCGKTIISLRRNMADGLLPILKDLGFACSEQRSENRFTVSRGGVANTFCLFGGRDESSAALIQGATFAGVLLDEVALMPRSFVEQACARCSVQGSKLWFNCNPEGPQHWFYLEWIQRAKERNALYLHFEMKDNPSLTPETIKRYMKMYSGVFHRRFVLGQWVSAQGLIYDFFDEKYVKNVPETTFEKWIVSCDYGTSNPTSMGLWGLSDGIWYRVKEYYYDSRRAGAQKTDAEYVDELKKLTDGVKLSAVVADPSAASFIEALRRQGIPVIRAKNDVLSGIRLTADMLKSGRLAICSGCKDSLREFQLYRWDENAAGYDAPVKENDHAMDEIRYFAATIAARTDETFTAMSVARGSF